MLLWHMHAHQIATIHPHAHITYDTMTCGSSHTGMSRFKQRMRCNEATMRGAHDASKMAVVLHTQPPTDCHTAPQPQPRQTDTASSLWGQAWLTCGGHTITPCVPTSFFQSVLVIN